MTVKKTILVLSIILGLTGVSYGSEANDLRSEFLNNNTSIMGINLRNFNSKDTNGNGIIDENEEKGTFLNAIERLDEIKELGINTLHVLPITPTGKLKALGTAGSLYSISDFTSINPQLVDKKSNLSPKEQAKKFIEECHKRNIHVIIDLPSCGSYDLFLKRPELFIKDDKNMSIVPTDWTDVRLLNTGNNEKLNQDLLNEHKEFINMVLELGADGIRADVATIKPYEFWVEIINYAREKNPKFMFLAEASDSWREPPSKYAEFTPYDKLLEAGFDGYYGSFFNLKDWNANDFIEHIKFNQKLLNSYKDKKSVIMSFTTHDEISPIVIHGEKFSVMISWLEATLPFNPYVIDGFPQGNDYIYPWANNKADYTETDDDYYFVHRGKLDIFNFSSNSEIKNKNIYEDFKNAGKFRNNNNNLISNGNFNSYKTNKDNIFAFSRSLNKETVYVIGNLDFNNNSNIVTIKIPKLKKSTDFDMIKGKDIRIKKNKIITSLKAGEIKVFKISLKG